MRLTAADGTATSASFIPHERATLFAAVVELVEDARHGSTLLVLVGAGVRFPPVDYNVGRWATRDAI